MNTVALPDHSAFYDPAKHSAPAADFFSQSRTKIIHLAARRTNHRDFEERFADLQRFPDFEAIDVQSVGGDVFADHSGTDLEGVQRFPVY